MKKSEIVIGGNYIAKVSNKETVVRVDSIRETTTIRAGKLSDTQVYDVTNLATKRTTTCRSAAKFRCPAPVETAAIECDSVLAQPGRVLPTDAEDIGVALPQIGIAPKSGLAAKLAERQTTEVTAPHVIIEARAGTGKTTTLVEGLKNLLDVPSDHPAAQNPSDQQRAVWDALNLSKGKVRTICFAAFNSAIARELQERVPAGCEAMTMHSLGYKAVRDTFGKVGVDEHRTDKIISEVTGQDIWDLRKNKPGFSDTVKKIVDLCKMNLTDYSLQSELVALAEHYEIEFDGVSSSEVFELVPKVIERCKDVGRDRTVHFSDMIWLPVALDLPVRKFDLLLVDEAQDLNRCQQALAKKAGKRLILCGDPKQAIYGFAGADSESMDRMYRELKGESCNRCDGLGYVRQEEANGMVRAVPATSGYVCAMCGNRPKCIKLPLTVTRRCGRAIVREANKIVVDFYAADTNGDGKVTSASMNKNATDYYTKEVESGDMILCRVNAPLVSECFRFIKTGRQANIQGRDIGQGLISTITRLMKGYDIDQPNSVLELTRRLSDWLDKETKKEQAKKFPSENKIINLQDKHDCLFCFTEGVDVVREVIRKIEAIFVDRKAEERRAGILLSSIHKAKGLEAKRVFFLEPDGAACPHPMATTPWQKEQEYNLRYVAITRAIEHLVFVK